jgi:signal transduction histidine kinase
MNRDAEPLQVPSLRVVPWSPGDRSRQLLDAISKVHQAKTLAGVETAAVEAVERALPGAAAALFARDAASTVVSLRAAGHRWRSAERDSPAWLATMTGAIAGLVRSQAPINGGLARSSPCEHSDEDGLHIAQVLVQAEGWPSGNLVVLWPGGVYAGEGELWMLEQFAVQLGLAIRHALAADEQARLLIAFKDAHEGLLRAEQRRLAGELAASVAHDINNTLTTVLGVSEWVLHSKPLDEDLRADLETVRTAASEATHSVKRLRMIARHSTAAQREPYPLDELVATSVQQLGSRLAELRARRAIAVELQARHQTCALVLVNAAEMLEVFHGVLMCAVEALAAGGRATVVTGEEQGVATVAVECQGQDVAVETLLRSLEPSFAIKPGVGRRLPLWICRDILVAHGGTLAVTATSRTASVAVTLPAHSEPDTVGHPGR